MKNLKSILQQFGLIILLIFLAVQVACDKQAPVTSSEFQEIQENQVVILKSANPLRFLRPFYIQKWIDDDGGSIWLGDSLSGKSGLVFPDDALNDDRLIRFYWESEGLLQADFAPEGLNFNRPVYIRLSYLEADLNGINQNRLKIYYYNPQTSHWEVIPNSTVHVAEKYVDGYIDHFSRYAIGDEQ